MMARCLGVLLLCGLGIGTARAALHPSEQVSFARGDSAYRERRNASRANEALREYRRALASHPLDPTAAWRVAMACQFVGLRSARNDDEKLALFREGRDAGEIGVKHDPRCAACHFWTAINIALYGQTAGIFKMIFTLGRVQDHLRASLALDPGYAYGGAYRLLAKIYEKLPGILGGNNQRALEYYRMAVATAPDEPMNYLDLAGLLRDRFHDSRQAFDVARRGIALPIPAEERVEAIDASGELRQLFETLRKERSLPVTDRG